MTTMDRADRMDRVDRTKDRAMHRLSQMIWRERELLEELDYAREVEHALTASGSRFAERAATEVERIEADLRSTDLMRAVAADAAATDLDLAPNPPLSELTEAAHEPWAGIFAEHRSALHPLSRGLPAGLVEFLR